MSNRNKGIVAFSISLLSIVITSYISLKVEHGSFFPMLFIPIIIVGTFYGRKGGLISGLLFSLYIFTFIYFILNNRDTVPYVLIAIIMFIGVGYIVGNLSELYKKTKYQENKLNKIIIEKDFLMKELNHRVKNNLNMVSSLISLKDAETEIDLSDIQHQIEAIGLIHEKLYKTENVREICCRDYLDDLLDSIFTSFTTQQVRIEKDVDDMCVSTKTAVSLGLIINEIATNAIKHGFTDKEEAVFTIEMKKENNQYKLTLSNTGTPFPESVDIESTDTLGLRLINALVAQIDGRIELQKKPNPVFTIKLPIGDE